MRLENLLEEYQDNLPVENVMEKYKITNEQVYLFMTYQTHFNSYGIFYEINENEITFTVI